MILLLACIESSAVLFEVAAITKAGWTPLRVTPTERAFLSAEAVRVTAAELVPPSAGRVPALALS